MTQDKGSVIRILFLIFFFCLIKTYPPRQEGESLVSTAEDAYTHAKDFLEGIQLNQEKSSSTSKYRDHREKNLKHVVSTDLGPNA